MSLKLASVLAEPKTGLDEDSTPGLSFPWTNERHWDVQSIIRDTVDDAKEPAVEIVTGPRADKAEVGRYAYSWGYSSYADFGQVLRFRKSDGALLGWSRKVTVECAFHGVKKSQHQRFIFTERWVLERIEDCGDSAPDPPEND